MFSFEDFIWYYDRNMPSTLLSQHYNAHRAHGLEIMPSSTLISVTVQGLFQKASLHVPSTHDGYDLVIDEQKSNNDKCVLTPFLRGIPMLSPVRILVETPKDDNVTLTWKVDHLDDCTALNVSTFRSTRHTSRGCGVLLESGDVIQFSHKHKGWMRVDRRENELPNYTGPRSWAFCPELRKVELFGPTHRVGLA
jgi:hypothetical protein